jgi:hypothetical protein
MNKTRLTTETKRRRLRVQALLKPTKKRPQK